MRKKLIIAVAVSILLLTNYSIYSRENLIQNGQSVLLKLAPVDPRSLMQGDYMALRFDVARSILPSDRTERGKAANGHIVLTLDEKNIGNFSRIDDGQDVSANEVRMKYRIRNYRVKLGTNAFFFQEGTRKIYEAAEYGEFKVGSNGRSILVAMYDEKLRKLGPAK